MKKFNRHLEVLKVLDDHNLNDVVKAMRLYCDSFALLSESQIDKLIRKVACVIEEPSPIDRVYVVEVHKTPAFNLNRGELVHIPGAGMATLVKRDNLTNEYTFREEFSGEENIIVSDRQMVHRSAS